MGMVSVAITVDRAEAVLAGNSEFGVQIVRVDLDALNTEELRTLAWSPWHNNDPNIFACTGLPGSSISYPKIALADEAAVKQVLAAIAAAAKAVAEAEDKRSQERRRQLIDRINQWLAKSDDELLIGKFGTRPGEMDVASIRVLPPDYTSGMMETLEPDLKALVAARLKQLKAFCEQHNAEVEKKRAANLARAAEADRAKAAAAKEAERAAAKALTDCVMRYGSVSQKERGKRGMLPRKEALGLYRDRMFADLDVFPRYERLTDKDIVAMETYDGPDYDPEFDYGVWKAEGLTEEEFATLQQIERIVFERLPAGAIVEPREHAGGYKGNSEWAVRRKSVLVTVNEPVKVSREYACP
jgi:hypothetical protein